MDERTRHIGRIQALFREVNDRVFALGQRFGTVSTFAIVCECGNDTCFAHITIDRRAYESIRADRATFAVVPGHEIESVGGVIERRDGYNVLRQEP